MTVGIKRTRDEIEIIVNNLGYELLDEYIENEVRKVVIKDRIGYKYKIELGSLLKPNKKLKIIHKNNPFSIDNIVLWLSINRADFQFLDNNSYKGSKNKINFYHKTCDEYFIMDWDSVSKYVGCPVCRGSQVGQRTSLAYKRPDLAREWHPNNTKTPNDVVCGSNDKVFWICSFCGYGEDKEWKARINDRNHNKGCPACANKQKESSIATELKQWCLEIFQDVDIEHKMFKNPETNAYLLCDIYLGEKESINGIYIEINGHQHYIFTPFWHKTKEDFEYNNDLDKIKKEYAMKHGTYIEIDLRKIKTTKDAISYIERKLPLDK